MGVFITRGMTVAIPHFNISMDENGAFHSDLKIHVHFDVCPSWLGVALRHLADAKCEQATRVEIWSTGPDDEKAAALEREFEASMQAIMAAAVAIDAFYAVVQSKVKIPQDLIDSWRENKTARYSQVAEVLRRAFTLQADAAKALRQALKDVYKYRDLAVHPSGKVDAPVLHPELQVGVEWRFVAFRYENAAAIVGNTRSIISQLANSKSQSDPVKRYCDALRPKVEVLQMPA